MKASDIEVGMKIIGDGENWVVTVVEYAVSNLTPAPPGHVFIADIVLVEMESPAYPLHAPNTGPMMQTRNWFRMGETVEASNAAWEKRDERNN